MRKIYGYCDMRKVSGIPYTIIYKSTDSNIIYFMEYCKVRNTKIYNQLNPNQNIKIPDIPATIINYEAKYRKYAKTSKIIESNKVIDAYNQMSKAKNVLIDFESRKEVKKTIIKKDDKPEEKVIQTKKQEMEAFKNSIKNYQKTELDLAAEKFERALKERNRYDAELRKNGYRVIKGRKNSGYERG